MGKVYRDKHDVYLGVAHYAGGLVTIPFFKLLKYLWQNRVKDNAKQADKAKG